MVRFRLRIPIFFALVAILSGCGHGGAGLRVAGVIDENPPPMSDPTSRKLAGAKAAAADLKVAVHLRDRKGDLPILPGQAVKAGSTISLQVSVAQEAYLRVYRVGAKDELTRVYPSSSEEAVRVQANRWLRVPRAGLALARSLGEESFLVIVHPSKDDDDARLMKLAWKAHKEEPVSARAHRVTKAQEAGAVMGVEEESTEVLLRSAEASVARVTVKH